MLALFGLDKFNVAKRSSLLQQIIKCIYPSYINAGRTLISTRGVFGANLACKCRIRFETVVAVKHSSLLQKMINYIYPSYINAADRRENARMNHFFDGHYYTRL